MTFKFGPSKSYLTIILLMQVGGILSSSYKLTPPAATNQIKTPSPVEFSARSLGTNCDTSYSPTCLKLDVVNFFERFSEAGDFSLLPGVTLVTEAGSDKGKVTEKVAELARSFPNEPEKRLDSYLMYKIGSFFDNHSLKFKLLDEGAKLDSLELFGDSELGRSSEGRKGFKGGKKGGMGGIIAMMMMMKGTLASLALGGLALLAGKALLTSLLALMLSGIIALKSLLSGGDKHSTYEIHAKPVYSQSHSHSASHEDVHGGDHYGHGYGRALDIQLPEHLKKNEP